MLVPQRGRAILHRLTVNEPVRVFRPGDFLLTQSSGLLARTLGWVTGCEVNHAALIIDPLGTVVETNPTIGIPGQAFRISSVSDYLRSGAPCWIGYVEVAAGTRDEVVSYAQHFVRARPVVSFPGQILTLVHLVVSTGPRAWSAKVPGFGWLHALLTRHAVVIREGYSCLSSEFVARALERGGFIWEHDPATVTPQLLLEKFRPAEQTAPSRPTPLPARRRSHAAGGNPRQGELGVIMPFASRGTNGATALAPAPARQDPTPEGTRALVQVGILVAAGLAVVGILEEVLRGIATES